MRNNILVEIIVSLFLVIIPFKTFSQIKPEIQSYHFEYGYGLMNIYSTPKLYEKDQILPFPVLDEYVVGVKIPFKKGYAIPNVGIFEKDYSLIQKDKRIVKSQYSFSGGCIVNYKKTYYKLSNIGFSFGITF